MTGAEPHQHPVFKATIEDDFPIALYRGGAKGTIPQDAQGFVYDAYISYADREPDAGFVWDNFVPQLRAAGLRVAVAHDVEQAGVYRVVDVERAVREAKFTVPILSPRYLQDAYGEFRILPVLFESVQLPERLGVYELRDLTRPTRAACQMERLIQELQGPLPTRAG